MMPKQTIQVMGTELLVLKIRESDYISLTDIARYKNRSEPKDVVANWLRLRNTVDYLGLWETINNPSFKGVEFEAFKKLAGTNAFTLSPSRWIENTKAVGLITKSGRHGGGTFAHKDIATKFASRVSIEFELYLIKEFQRLKELELKSTDRNVKRFLTKMNYKIHTDAIKDNLIPIELSKEQISHIYADEADVLNIALFGQTAKDRRDQNSNTKGNIRDEATIEQLIILANIESMNAEYIKLGLPQSKRLKLSNQTAISQMKSLLGMNMKKLA